VFLEYLTGFGGEILDAEGRVVVDSPAAVRALAAMRDALEAGIVPRRALTWHEEETRFAFQNGRALLMRNWPYAAALLAGDPDSRVAGRFGVAPMPAGPGGRPGSALGGSQLAINARSRHPEAAWLLIEYLTRPTQMLERARRAGQLPARRALYEGPDLADALPLPPAALRAVVERAVPRPVTPVYSELSELLQVRLHRALTGQQAPGPALEDAAREIRALLERVKLAPPEAARAS
jgi:multiple sugar transport system substrate-binding protein